MSGLRIMLKRWSSRPPTDGNPVVYKKNSDGDKPEDAVWSSNTYASGDAYSLLAIQNDGNIVIYAGNGASWDALHHNSKGRLGQDTVNGDANSGTTYQGKQPS